MVQLLTDLGIKSEENCFLVPHWYYEGSSEDWIIYTVDSLPEIKGPMILSLLK